MKIKRLVLGCLLIVFNSTLGQTDAKNQQKYWKVRNTYRQDYVRIGIEAGESLPMGRRGWGKCIDNLDYTENFGQLYWGDGVIRHGHYIGFLATEYKLLSNNNQDVTQVLNELYYALKAFNRLDLNAEPIMSNERSNVSPQPPNLNGFYIRDDVPKDFDDHWKDEPIQARGVEGSYYSNNNAAHVDSEDNNPGGFYNAEPEHKFGWGNPSLDQMSSILVGLTVCHKLLPDNLWVQPTPNDPGIDLKNEVAQITHRIVEYANQHNWQLLNIYGWPVVNGGGELVVTAYPISIIGHNITGLNYNNPIIRRVNQVKNVVMSKLYKSDNILEQVELISQLGTIDNLKYASINEDYFNLWPNGYSNFEQWQLSASISVPINLSANLWTQNSYFAPGLSSDWNDNQKFDSIFSGPISQIKFEDLNLFKDYNNAIMMNLGVSSGLFTKNNTKLWEDETHHHQLALIQALLTDNIPVNSKQFYKHILDSYPVYGAFKYRENNNWQNPLMTQTVYPTNWGGEYRWTHYGESTTAEKGLAGQFAGLDYMYLHNLYNLIFPNNLPEYEEKYSCICETIDNTDLQISNTYHATDTAVFIKQGSTIVQDYLPNIHIVEHIEYIVISGTYEKTKITYSYMPQADYDAIQNELTQNGGLLNNNVYQLSNLESCVPNDFIDLGNSLNTQYTMGMLHDNYEAMKVYTNNYQTEMFTVQNGGELDVRSRVVVCEDQTLNIQAGGKVNLLSGEIRVNENATIFVSGELFIDNHKKLILEEGAKLVILSGGLLYNKGEVIVNNNAQIIYHPNAKIKMDQEYAEINFKGGDLHIEDNASFSVMHGNGASGQLRFSTWGKHIFAGQNTEFKMEGVSNDDVIIIVNKDGDFWSEDNVNGRLNKIQVTQGKVMLHENARFVSTADYLYTFNTKFVSDANNRGIVTFDRTRLIISEFNDVKIKSVNIYRPYAYFRAQNCVFNVTDGYLPNNGGFQKALTINGKVYYLDHCVFNTENYTTAFSENLNYTSTVNSCTFNNPNDFESKVEDQSNVLLSLKNNTFNNSDNGVSKKYGSLALRCNTFNGCYDAVKLNSHANLNMSTSGLNIGNGYNVFTNTHHTDIKFDHAGSPTINNGYNDFTINNPYGKTFEGNAYILDAGIGPVITAQKNAWNGQAAVAPQSNFNIFSLTTNSPATITSTQPALSFCGQFDGDIGNPSFYSGNINPSIENSNNNANSQLSLNQLIINATNMSEIHDSTGNNLESLDLFYDIIMYDYSTIHGVKMIEVAKALNYAFYQMKHTLHDAFSKKQIDIKNYKLISPYVVKFIDVLNKRSDFIQFLNKKEEVFFNEIEKVEFLRIFGKYNLAIDILNNIEYCGSIDSLEQAVLNSFKFNILEEQACVNYGYEASLIDTTFTDTSSFSQPINQDINSYGFKSVIIDLNNISFTNDCNGRMANTNNLDKDIQISVYPNPSLNIVNFDVVIDNEFGGLINIYSMDGKLTTTIKLNSGHNYHQIDFDKYETGVYYYNLIIDDNTIKNGKIVIQN